MPLYMTRVGSPASVHLVPGLVITGKELSSLKHPDLQSDADPEEQISIEYLPAGRNGDKVILCVKTTHGMEIRFGFAAEFEEAVLVIGNDRYRFSFSTPALQD